MLTPSPLLPLVQALLAQNSPADASATGAADAPEAVSLLDYILDAGLVSYLLIACSVLAVALVIRNAILLRRNHVLRPDIVRQLEAHLVAGNIREAERFCQQPENDCFVARVFGHALTRCSRSPFGIMEIRSGAEEAGATEVEQMHRLNDGIGILAAVAPMLGLLGTVIGMIGAFQTIGSLTGSARSNQLALFMSMALVNTAEGLVIAIPCTVAFALFRRRIETLTKTLGDTIERLLGHAQSTAQPATPSIGPSVAQSASQPARPTPRPAPTGAQR